jgi:hypothetical protein
MVVNLLFGTTPVVIHAQGSHGYKPYWRPIKERFFASPPRRLGPVPDLTILTWNNGHEAMGILERSLEHLGVPCLVLGHGVEHWVNSRDKPRLTRDALGEIETGYVMGVDSRDAIFVEDPRLVLERFRAEFDCELVFSADRMNWPNRADFKRFEDSLPGAAASDFRYLNSGAWVGRTAFCREFFAAAVETPPAAEAPEADQGILKQLFQTFHPRVQLDYRSSMFLNIGFVFDQILRVD